MTESGSHSGQHGLSETLLSVRDLRVEYATTSGRVRAVNDVSFDISSGEMLGLAGESGSGKSTVAHAIVRILRPPGIITGGQVLLGGRDLLRTPLNELRKIRWREVALVLQSAMNALNPVLTVGQQIDDVLRAHARFEPQRGAQLMELVGMGTQQLSSYPHQLSGGMRQRAVIAIALALEPRLLILDEPTTALDVIVQREILEQLRDLRAKLGFSVLFITHDLSLLFEYADRLGVLYAGRLVELGPSERLRRAARHPYTADLVACSPSVHRQLDLVEIPGTPPALQNLPSGCAYHPRCRHTLEVCRAEVPPFRPLPTEQTANTAQPGQTRSHRSACWLNSPDAEQEPNQ